MDETTSVNKARSELERQLVLVFDEVDRVEHESTGAVPSRRVFDVDPDRRPVVLVEDVATGLVSWSFPLARKSGRGVEFELGVDSPDYGRSAPNQVARKILRVLAPKADSANDNTGQSYARHWEEQHRPEGLRRFDPEAASFDTGDERVRPEPSQLRDGPILLLLHGPLATTSGGFADLRGLGLSRLSEQYEGRILAYDHFTLSKSPDDNAGGLLSALAPFRDPKSDRTLSLDVLAHSRGGLVARKLAELTTDQAHNIKLTNVWFVGTPNAGTPVCDTGNLGQFADRMTNLLSWIPASAAGETVQALLAVVQHLLFSAEEGLPGVAAMDPKIREFDITPPPHDVHFFGLASDFAPQKGTPFPKRATRLLSGQLISRPNDLFVSPASVFGTRERPLVPPAHRRTFGPAEAVTHSGYFDHPDTVAFVLQSAAIRNDITRSSTGSGAPERISRQQSRPGEDASQVTFSITHASLEEAEYALMVGSFADEALSGAERYLDARLGGILRARYDVDHYPDGLGTSMFIDPYPDEPTMPPAAHIVGLGRTTDLGRAELTHAVRQALMRRCLRLYDGRPPKGSPPVEVGVSSILMGVRNNDGLSIPDSVAGIAKGVLETNSLLAQYEANLEGSYAGPSVRITRLEFIERYGERADAAAAALRALAGTIRLGPGYDYLEKVNVLKGPGGLPAGSGVADGQTDWRRFLITESMADQRAPQDVPDQHRPLVLDVALLGADAAAGRAQHRLSRTIVDALVDRLAEEPGDTITAGTLYDHLVPEEMRQRFKTSGSVQLIVDAVTANYPWELLTAPRPGRAFDRQALAVSGSVLRQFSESGSRRLDINRATHRAALVIGAGKVVGQNALPAALAEADRVFAALNDDALYETTLLHDGERELGVIELANNLFGNHRILHIASHGEYQEGRPEATGAILSSQYLLTVETVRQLRWVPDLVFLNCCSLGRIGLPRLAAGLAREFMAIGARAVVAAGWPIADASALAFAEAFYERILGGATFGDAVAAARIAAVEGSSDETWAAYQCYGDPAFELAVPRSKQRTATSEPISRDDLLRRVALLGIRASDLRRVDGAGLERSRTSLVESLDEFASWADERLAGDIEIQRQLAQVAKDLGEFARAADRYESLIERKGRSYRLHPSGSVRDLREFANCLARDAQRSARKAATPQERTDAAVKMKTALAAAKRAAGLREDKESWGILGSTLKKLATVDADRRDAHLRAALDAYGKANAFDDGGRYGAENAAQLAAVLGVDNPAVDTDAPPTVKGRAAARRVIDQRDPSETDFWAKADGGDRALTRLLRAEGPDEAATHQHHMVDAYKAAFATRSTWSQRNSSLDHLRDLFEVLSKDDWRRGLVQEALAELRQWEADNVAAEEADNVAAEEGDDNPSSTRTKSSSTKRRRTSQVTVVALPAGRGDCIWIEYQDGADQRRILIDGGLGSAYQAGLGAHLARVGGGEPVAVDTLVVTHIDLDHIEGVIEAIKTGAVTFADVWFNGMMQPVDVRGPRQGDEFEALLPPARRNVVANGRHLVVEENAPLPFYRLPGGARCTLLSPNRNRLERLLEVWAKSRTRGGSGTLLESLSEQLDADDEQLTVRSGKRRLGSDASIANGSSIAFLFEHADVAALFTGDAFASVLQHSIERLLSDRGKSRLELDLLKLSHHGSDGNITPELLELLDCDRFLVCTDGWKGRHPSGQTIELIKKVRPEAKFLFNYDNEFTALWSDGERVNSSTADSQTGPLRIELGG